MAQLFHRSANAVARFTIFGGIFLLAGLAYAGWIFAHSSFMTGENVYLKQPVPFSHDHHTAGLGIDCRYCHTSVEESNFAGIPPVATCMNCHNIMWNRDEMLAPIRDAYAGGDPIEWSRVYDMPDYVYFDHSIHLRKGMGCEVCHGRVDRQPLIRQATSLQMDWCLECHRDPAKFIRPRDKVFTMGYRPEGDAAALAAQLIEEYEVKPGTDCGVCHR
jgi:Cytochrome c7 and related cytochrome c/Class III cytochrome C family